MKHKTALLLGAYGQTNLGDDLLLYDYLKYLREQGFTKIFVNASEERYIPAIIHETFSEMEVFETYRTSPFALLGLMRQADVIFYGGGTVFKELYSTTGRAPYTVIAGVAAYNVMAKLFGKKVYGLHIGIGSIKTGLGRWFSRIALKAATYTVFRDQKSYRYALDVLKVPKHKIAHSTDGLFLNTDWQKPWHTYTLKRKNAKQPLIGVNVLSDIPDWVDRDTYIRNIRELVAELLEQGNYIVLIPFQVDFNPTNDLKFIQQEIVPHIKEYDSYKVLDDVGIDTVVSLFQQLDILVGMRLHSLLLATAANTPFVAIAYDTKCWRFIEEADYPYALKLEDMTVEGVMKQFTAAQKNREVAKKKLQQVANANYKEAETWMKKFTP